MLQSDGFVFVSKEHVMTVCRGTLWSKCS